jgi:hypothetical protein
MAFFVFVDIPGVSKRLARANSPTTNGQLVRTRRWPAGSPDRLVSAYASLKAPVHADVTRPPLSVIAWCWSAGTQRDGSTWPVQADEPAQGHAHDAPPVIRLQESGHWTRGVAVIA